MYNIFFMVYTNFYPTNVSFVYCQKEKNWYMKYGSHEYALQHNIKNINVMTTQDSILYPNF